MEPNLPVEQLAGQYGELLDKAGFVVRTPVARPSGDESERFTAFASMAGAGIVLALMQSYAIVSGLPEAEDFSSTCLPATRAGGRGLVRATTISVGMVEVFSASVARGTGEVEGWFFCVPSDEDIDRWPNTVTCTLDAPTMGGGCLRIVGESLDDWDTLVRSPVVRRAMRRRLEDLRGRPPRPTRRPDWHNDVLWRTVTDASVNHPNAPASATMSTEPIDVTTEDRMAYVRVRQAQDRFRALLLANQANCCALCGLEVVEVLDAAHLVAHSEGGRATLDNGRLLCANHHRAFDGGLLRFDPTLDAFQWCGNRRF